jgi:Type II CAAX prenyl endopeptidase Rce1-like
MSYDIRSALGWITVIAVFISVVTYFLSLFTGFLLVATTQLGSQLQGITGSLAIEAFLLIIPTSIPVNGLLLVVISLITFAVCFAKAATANGGFLSGVRILSLGSRPRTLPNWLAVMPLLGSSLFVVVLALTLIQNVGGVSTGSLNTGNPAILFASLTLSPVAEEIGFRVSAIGPVVAILVAIKLSRISTAGTPRTPQNPIVVVLSAFLSPGYAKERAGLPSVRTCGLKGISTVEWVALLFTSAVFGAYHIISGVGWGPGKFLTAALSGFVLGIVYLSYGAYADILLHWFFNFYLYAYSVYTGFNGVFIILGDLAALGTLALGVWGIIVGVKWSLEKKPQPIAPTPFDNVGILHPQ